MSKKLAGKTKAREERSPLYATIKADTKVSAKPKTKAKQLNSSKQEDEESYLPPALSQKLLKQVRDQQLEEGVLLQAEKQNGALAHFSSEEEEYDEDETQYEAQNLHVDPDDESALAMFMSPGAGGKKILNLGELIMSKIQEKEAQSAAGGGALESQFDPKVVQVYSQIGLLLARYKSGKIPRAVKIIPLLKNWEEILFLTQPDNWTPQATGAITRAFTSNFNEKLAQRYFNLVLLPAVRRDIRSHKKLNFHLYYALKKTLYKPNAFFKGFLIPLCESMECSLLEATIVGSVIAKVSIPTIPASVALMKICTMPYSGSNSMFIRTIIDKRYALPYKVVDALVDHFVSFKKETRVLPVLWHQSLLSFAQRYKEELTPEQKTELKYLLREQVHHQITPEIQRELFNAKCRGNLPLEMDVE